MRRLTSATTIVALALLAGCRVADPTEINWAAVREADVSCLGKANVVTEEYYDLNGDGSDEVFLVMKCASKNDPPGHQLEIIAGGTDPETAHPTKRVLQIPGPPVIDRMHFARRTATYRVSIAGKARMWQVRWSEGAAKPGPATPCPATGCP